MPPFTKSGRGRAGRTLGLETLEDRSLLSSTPVGPALDLSSLQLSQEHDSKHILVQFRSENLASGTPTASLAGTTVEQALDLVPGLWQVALDSDVSVEAALKAYRDDSRVAYAEPDYLLSTKWIPNDSQFGTQWDLRNTGQSGGTYGADINAASAWDVNRGSTKVVVAIMDSGIDYTHPDLYRNIWLNQKEIPLSRSANLLDIDGDRLITFRDLNDSRNQGKGKITDLNGDRVIDARDILAPMNKDYRGYDLGTGGWADGISQDGDTAHIDDLVGWNFTNNTNKPLDDYGHGTHVAGTIGADGNNGISTLR